jgi:hypothetical protein
MMDGTLETIDGRPAVRFEHRLPHSIERVWRAVSEPAEPGVAGGPSCSWVLPTSPNRVGGGP